MAAVFEGRDGVSAYQAIALKMAMKLSSAGIQPGRSWTKKNMLRLAEKFTGKTYGPGVKSWNQAVQDVCDYVEKLKNA